MRENAILSHDNLGRKFAALDPHEVKAAFRRRVGQLIPVFEADTVVAIDGKTKRERRYCISSPPTDAKRTAHVMRAHRKVKN